MGFSSFFFFFPSDRKISIFEFFKSPSCITFFILVTELKFLNGEDFQILPDFIEKNGQNFQKIYFIKYGCSNSSSFFFFFIENLVIEHGIQMR